MSDQEKDTAKTEQPSESIGFLRAAEKMQIATFEIPLIFLEDIGFSKDRIRPFKEFNRRFVSGFYGRLRRLTDRSGRRAAPSAPAAAKAAAKRAPDKASAAPPAAKAAARRAPDKASAAPPAAAAARSDSKPKKKKAGAARDEDS